MVIEADKLSRSGKPIIYTNIGNPHSVGQSPLTWPRQVLALVDLPFRVGVDHPDVSKVSLSASMLLALKISHPLVPPFKKCALSITDAIIVTLIPNYFLHRIASLIAALP